MDEAGEKVLFVVDEHQKLMGSLTDGDIRRWILKEGSLSESLSAVYHRHPRVLREGGDFEAARHLMAEEKIEALPVVDGEGAILDVLFWSDLFSGKVVRTDPLRIPVLVMAGGKGTRLDPFTRILPKPLIPIGDKPIVELIMDQFSEFGCSDFFLTVNYKGKMVQSYFDNVEYPFNIKFVWEEDYLGTAGSVKLAAPLIDSPHLFVSNCDILIKADYDDIFQFHLKNNNDVTVVGSMQHVSVPFGVLEMRNGGHLEKIVEKPELDFLANTGMYLIKSEVSNLIPPGIPFDFTDLLIRVKESGGRVSIYPVSQQSWIDIGQWQEYQSAIKKLQLSE